MQLTIVLWGMAESPAPLPEVLVNWADRDLLDAWMASGWEAGDPVADALAAELERRNLDF